MQLGPFPLLSTGKCFFLPTLLQTFPVAIHGRMLHLFASNPRLL